MDPLSQVWQIALALLLIVALVFLLGFVAKRVQGIRRFKGGVMQILDSTSLGTREKLILVQVENKKVLLGVNQQCIAKLLEFDAPQSGFAEVLADCKQDDVA